MKVCYPQFLAFVEHQNKIIESELKDIENKRTSVTFFPTMRAILDAKWNEILVTEDMRYPIVETNKLRCKISRICLRVA